MANHHEFAFKARSQKTGSHRFWGVGSVLKSFDSAAKMSMYKSIADAAASPEEHTRC